MENSPPSPPEPPGGGLSEAEDPEFSESVREFQVRTRALRRQIAAMGLAQPVEQALGHIIRLVEDVGIQVSRVRHAELNLEAVVELRFGEILRGQDRVLSRLFGADDAVGHPDNRGAVGGLFDSLGAIRSLLRWWIGTTIAVGVLAIAALTLLATLGLHLGGT